VESHSNVDVKGGAPVNRLAGRDSSWHTDREERPRPRKTSAVLLAEPFSRMRQLKGGVLPCSGCTTVGKKAILEATVHEGFAADLYSLWRNLLFSSMIFPDPSPLIGSTLPPSRPKESVGESMNRVGFSKRQKATWQKVIDSLLSCLIPFLEGRNMPSLSRFWGALWSPRRHRILPGRGAGAVTAARWRRWRTRGLRSNQPAESCR